MEQLQTPASHFPLPVTFFPRARLRHHGEKLLELTREVRDVRAFASSLQGAVEAQRQKAEKGANQEKSSVQDLGERLDLMQGKVEALTAMEQRGAKQRMDHVDQRVDDVDARLSSLSRSTSQELRFLAQQVRDIEGSLSKRVESNEKTSEHLQGQVQDVICCVKDLPVAGLLSGCSLPSDAEERMLQALQDTRCQLESQIVQMLDREQRQKLQSDIRAPEETWLTKMALDVRKEFDQKLADTGIATQQLLRELRQELEARSSQSQRQGDELRRELELKLDRKYSTSEIGLEELRHSLDNIRNQQQGTCHKLSEDIKQLSAELEVRLVKAQGSSQRLAAELRKDLDARQQLKAGEVSGATVA